MTWTSEITNDPNHDYDLYVELLEDDVHKGRVQRQEDGKIALVLTGEGVSIPGDWIRSILERTPAVAPPYD